MLDDFLVRATLAGIGLAIVTGPTGCFIVWRRLAYFGETIAHSALLGVAFAILIEIHFVIGIFTTATAVVLVLGFLERQDTLPTDTHLALLSHGGLASGLVILSFFPNLRIDLEVLLFGDILAVSRTDLVVIWVGGVIAIGVLLWIWRPLLAATVSTELAEVAGLNPARSHLIFGILLAGIIAAAIKIVGVLLIVALLVIPAATVRRFALSPERMAVYAAVVGIFAVAGGMFTSAYIDTPTGPLNRYDYIDHFLSYSNWRTTEINRYNWHSLDITALNLFKLIGLEDKLSDSAPNEIYWFALPHSKVKLANLVIFVKFI